ncbi:MAG TPA: ABC transporter substrate-binding protein [Streptosporangiaceae bacterium]|nr:ABC transporter substrate-binding protein [Streptosporangiaceae bacterium]
MRRNRTVALAAALCAAGLVAAGCGNSSTGGGNSSSSAGKPLIISDVTGANWNCQFNPLSTNWPEGGPTETGIIYEPLMFEDLLETGTQLSKGIHPWLATGYSWNSSLTALTFTIRKGVKFTDGTPMTPADVAFSFNILNKNGALDLWSLWKAQGGPLTSVTTSGDTVTLHFDAPSPTYFYYAAGQVPILPAHIWSKIPVSKLPTYPDNHPVGTGAYEVGSCSSTNLIYKANPNYWQPGKPAVKTVEWPAYLDNTTGNNCLINGQCQWGGQYIPNINGTYIAKDPSAYHNWAPSVSSVTLDINLGLKNSPLDNVMVRQAMALAINRNQVGAIGETGSETGSFQDGVAASFRSGGWVDQAQANSYYNDYAFNPSQAEHLLDQAGYSKMVGGVRENSAGQKLAFTMVNNGGYSDWVADGTVIAQQLAKVGIQVTPRNESGNAWSSDLSLGHFELGIDDQTSGPGPEYEMRQWLFSGNTAPIGKAASTNFGRYSNAATDALFNSYGMTDNLSTQRSIVFKLEKVLLSDVPYIPVLTAVSWDQYNSAQFTGWPDAANPYAQGQTAYPDWGWDLLNIKPAS